GVWDGAEFVVQNYLTGAAATLSPLVLHALGDAGEFVSRAAIAEAIGLGAASRAIVRALVASDVLLVRGSAKEELDQRVDDSWAWSHDARFFHFATRQIEFRDDFAAQRDHLPARALNPPPPEPFITT